MSWQLEIHHRRWQVVGFGVAAVVLGGLLTLAPVRGGRASPTAAFTGLAIGAAAAAGLFPLMNRRGRMASLMAVAVFSIGFMLAGFALFWWSAVIMFVAGGAFLCVKAFDSTSALRLDPHGVHLRPLAWKPVVVIPWSNVSGFTGLRLFGSTLVSVHGDATGLAVPRPFGLADDVLASVQVIQGRRDVERFVTGAEEWRRSLTEEKCDPAHDCDAPAEP